MKVMMERSSRKLNNHYLHQKFDVLGLMYPARKVLANFQPLDMPEKDNQVVNLFSHSCVTETFSRSNFIPILSGQSKYTSLVGQQL